MMSTSFTLARPELDFSPEVVRDSNAIDNLALVPPLLPKLPGGDCRPPAPQFRRLPGVRGNAGITAHILMVGHLTPTVGGDSTAPPCCLTPGWRHLQGVACRRI
jgi:hypothetical protein